jgi:putative transposase
MSSVFSISGRRRYGLARVCRVWDVPRAGIYRRRRAANLPEPPRRRPGPQGAMPDAALVEEIRVVPTDSPFHGEGYRRVWARLRHRGLRTSKERVRRLMRESGLSAGTGRATPRGPRAHDGTIIPDMVDTMWGTDMTAAVTREHGQVAVFVAVDHCSAECVGIHAALRGTRHEALKPVRQGVTARFGAIGKDIAAGLSLRHDHGSQYMSHDFQSEIRWLGIASSPAFIRAPEGNGCAERFIRTLKENLLWVRTFDTVEELREALIDFRTAYNEHWLIERHGHRSPAQFRREQMDSQPMAAQMQTGVSETGGGTHCPSPEPRMDRRPFAERRRKIAPRRCGARQPQHGIDKQSVVDTIMPIPGLCRCGSVIPTALNFDRFCIVSGCD